jgi:hypothetical protein
MENTKEVASYIDDIKTRVTDMLPRIISWMLMKENGETLPELLAKAKKRYFAIAVEQPEDIDYKKTYLSRIGNEDWNSYSLGVKAHYMAAMALYSSYDCGHLAMHMLDHMSEGNHNVGTEDELREDMCNLIDIPPFEECRDWELLDHCARMAAYDLAFDEAMSDGMAALDIVRELAGDSANTLMDAYDKHRERYAKTLDLDKPEEDDNDDDE